MDKSLLFEALSHFRTAQEEFSKCSRILLDLIAEEDAKADFAALQYNQIDEHLRRIHARTFGCKENADAKTSEESQSFVEFTDKEIKQMPKHIQQLIIVNRKRCRIRKHKSGKDTFTYEISFRRDGYCIYACGVTKELAKANMLEKLRAVQPKKAEQDEVPKTFHSFATFYFENYRKERVAEKTLKNDLNRYNLYLKPYFEEKPLAKILPSDCKNLLDAVEKDEKYKTSEELHSILTCIFNCAIAHNLLAHNPMATVLRVTYDRTSSTALTKNEETTLLSEMRSEPLFELALALALYTGLRPNELATAQIEGDFIHAVNSKRKRKKNSKRRNVEYKRIYICDRLRPYLANGLPTLPTPQLLRRRIKNVLPNHMLKDLRKTFNSRCKELGVAPPAREHFMGHATSLLDATYTQLSVEYLLEEGKKLNKW